MQKDRDTFGLIYVMFSSHPKCSKLYIGQSSQPNPNSRFLNHINDAFRKGTKEYDFKISRAIRKYGKQTWKFLIIDKYLKYLEINKTPHYIQNSSLFSGNGPIFKAKSQDELDRLEILWIAEFDSYYNGYNSTLGGEGRRFVEGFTETAISQYNNLLMRGFQKTQIVSDKNKNKKKSKLKLGKNPFEHISYSQFELRFAYSDLSYEELEIIHKNEVFARFFNNYNRQKALANIIEIEKALNINHFESIESNKKNLAQTLSIQELKKRFKNIIKNNTGFLNKILDFYQIPNKIRSNIIPNSDLSSGRIGDIRAAIIIDLFEYNRIFSSDYLKEKFKSTRDIIRTSPIQKGAKRIYGEFFNVVSNWQIKSIETYDKIVIKLDSRRWNNYKQLVFIENLLINIPFISPKRLAQLYYNGKFSETQRKNLSRKLNLIKKLAVSNERLSELYLTKKIP